MDPYCAAATDGQEQLPEHATVAVASAPLLMILSYLPASQLLQVEAPAIEYLPASHLEQVSTAVAPTARENFPATQLLQVEAPAIEYVPATMSPSLSAHPQLLPMPARVIPWHPAVECAVGD